MERVKVAIYQMMEKNWYLYHVYVQNAMAKVGMKNYAKIVLH